MTLLYKYIIICFLPILEYMNNSPEIGIEIQPITKPETPEKIKEAPIKVPNPFTIPIPQIQPNTKPSPKA